MNLLDYKCFYLLISLIYVLVLDTFHINPQLNLTLNETEEVIISLNQHSIMEPKASIQIHFLYTYLSICKIPYIFIYSLSNRTPSVLT